MAGERGEKVQCYFLFPCLFFCSIGGSINRLDFVRKNEEQGRREECMLWSCTQVVNSELGWKRRFE